MCRLGCPARSALSGSPATRASTSTRPSTHTSDGVLHIEDPAPPYTLTLGQLFDVWQVRLGNGCLGATCSGLRAWVNGAPWAGDAREIPLNDHNEIVLALGPTYPNPVPSTYPFPPGL